MSGAGSQHLLRSNNRGVEFECTVIRMRGGSPYRFWQSELSAHEYSTKAGVSCLCVVCVFLCDFTCDVPAQLHNVSCLPSIPDDSTANRAQILSAKMEYRLN